jgi:hypothetical protein
MGSIDVNEDNKHIRNLGEESTNSLWSAKTGGIEKNIAQGRASGTEKS